MKDKKLRQYYKRQDKHLDDWLEMNDIVQTLVDTNQGAFESRNHNCRGSKTSRWQKYTQGLLEPFKPALSKVSKCPAMNLATHVGFAIYVFLAKGITIWNMLFPVSMASLVIPILNSIYAPITPTGYNNFIALSQKQFSMEAQNSTEGR